MSWSFSANGHALLADAEQALLNDLRELFRKHADITAYTSFAGATGSETGLHSAAPDPTASPVQPATTNILPDQVGQTLAGEPAQEPAPAAEGGEAGDQAALADAPDQDAAGDSGETGSPQI